MFGKFWSVWVISCVVFVTLLDAMAFGQTPGPLDLDRQVRRTADRVRDLLAEGGEPGRAEAEALLTDQLERRLNEGERAVILSLRGRVRALSGRDAWPTAIDDLGEALRPDILPGYIEGPLRALEVNLLLEMDRREAAIDAYEEDPAGFGADREEIAPAIAQAYASLRRPDEGLAVLTLMVDESEAALPGVEAFRYVMLLQLGRLDEAEEALAGYAAFPLGEPTPAAPARARLVALREGTPSPDELRSAAVSFLDANAAWQETVSDAEPEVRVMPTGFERCIGRGSGQREEVVSFRFDVTPSGKPTNITVLESTDACYDRHAVQAVEQWQYRPAMKDGKPVFRPDMRSQLKFVVGG